MHKNAIKGTVCSSVAFLAGISAGAFIELTINGTAALSAERILLCVIPPLITAWLFFALWRKLWKMQPYLNSSLPFIPFLFLAPFLPDFFHGKPPGPGITAGLIALSIAGSLFLLYFLLSKSREIFLNHLDRRAPAYLWSIITVATVVFLIFNWIKINNFAFNGKDTAIYIQGLWSAAHGKPFYVSLMKGPRVHFSPIMLLFVPFYALVPGIWSLVILRTIAITTTAGIVFAVLRTRLGRTAGLLLAVAYLLQPPIYHQTTFEFSWMEIAPTFLALTFLFLLKEKKVLFILAAFFAVTTREDIALTVFALGVYSLFAGKGKFWAIYPMALGAVWIILVRKVLTPHLIQSPRYFEHLSILALGPKESFHFLTHDPIGFISFFLTFPKIRYVLLLLLPAGLILPLCSLISIVAIPSITLVLSFRQGFPFDSVWHYGMPASLFLLLGSGFSIARLSRGTVFQARCRSTTLALLVLLLSTMLAYRANLYDWFLGDTFRQSPYTAAPPATLKTALKTISPSAPVFAPRYLLPWLSYRKVACLSIAHHPMDDGAVRPYSPYEIDYLIIDEATIHPITRAKYENDFVRGLPDNPYFKKIFSRDGVKVYRREGPIHRALPYDKPLL